jgi:hypothetical protein
VQALPDPSAQELLPKVVTRRRHQQQDRQRQRAEQLKGRRRACERRIEAQQRDRLRDVRVREVETQYGVGVEQRDPAHRDAQVAPVVQQGLPAWIETRERPDAQDQREQQERTAAVRTHVTHRVANRFVPGLLRAQHALEQRQEPGDAQRQRDIIGPLETIPLHGHVAMTHGVPP